MCMDCVIEQLAEVEADGRKRPVPIPVTDLMREVYALVDRFEESGELPQCGTGGPLHIITQDTNVDDDSLAGCWANLYELPPDGPLKGGDNGSYRGWWRREQTPEQNELMERLGGAIMWGLSSMTPAERAACINLDQYEHWAASGTRFAMVDESTSAMTTVVVGRSIWDPPAGMERPAEGSIFEDGAWRPPGSTLADGTTVPEP